MLASILAFFPLFELHLLHLLLLLLFYSLCAFWQCCLMLMSAIECGASVIFFYIYFRNLFCLLARFWLLSCPLASYSIHWLFVVSVLSSATISNSNTNTIPLANIVVMSRPLTPFSPSFSLSVLLALHLKFNLEIEFDCFEFAAALLLLLFVSPFVFISKLFQVSMHTYLLMARTPLLRALLIRFSSWQAKVAEKKKLYENLIRAGTY